MATVIYSRGEINLQNILTDSELAWPDTRSDTRSGTRLTPEELGWLDTVFTQVNEEMHESLAKLGRAPLVHTLQDTAVSSLHGSSERLRRTLIKRAHAEDFIALEALGRVRLSKETRKAELKRLKRKYKKRKKYTFRYGRKHNKQKAKTRKEYNNRRWEKDPLTRLKYTSRKPVNITQADWDRCIASVWEQYDRKHLKIKGGDRDNGYTIHNMLLEYHPPRERYARKTPKPVAVYNGFDQAVYDNMGGIHGT